MTDPVPVRFLFGGSLFFNVMMAKADAIGLIKGFAEGKLSPLIADIEGRWSVRVASLHAIHIVDEEEVPPTPPGSGLPSPWSYTPSRS